MEQFVKGHLVAELARKAEVSREYVKKLVSNEREANTEVSKKIMKAATILHKALEGAEVKINKLFPLPLH